MATRAAPERARVRRGDGDVVEEAEAHRPVALGVVAGRPHQRQDPRVRRRPSRARPRRPPRPPPAARPRRSPATCTCPDRARSLPAVSAMRRRYSRVVHARELLARRLARRHDLAAAPAPLAGDDVHHLGALGPLGMAGRRLVFGEPLRRDDDEDISQTAMRRQTRHDQRLHRRDREDRRLVSAVLSSERLIGDSVMDRDRGSGIRDRGSGIRD